MAYAFLKARLGERGEVGGGNVRIRFFYNDHVSAVAGAVNAVVLAAGYHGQSRRFIRQRAAAHGVGGEYYAAFSALPGNGQQREKFVCRAGYFVVAAGGKDYPSAVRRYAVRAVAQLFICAPALGVSRVAYKDVMTLGGIFLTGHKHIAGKRHLGGADAPKGFCHGACRFKLGGGAALAVDHPVYRFAARYDLKLPRC